MSCTGHICLGYQDVEFTETSLFLPVELNSPRWLSIYLAIVSLLQSTDQTYIDIPQNNIARVNSVAQWWGVSKEATLSFHSYARWITVLPEACIGTGWLKYKMHHWTTLTKYLYLPLQTSVRQQHDHGQGFLRRIDHAWCKNVTSTWHAPSLDEMVLSLSDVLADGAAFLR